jgi:hypothetical protein
MFSAKSPPPSAADIDARKEKLRSIYKTRGPAGVILLAMMFPACFFLGTLFTPNQFLCILLLFYIPGGFLSALAWGAHAGLKQFQPLPDQATDSRVLAASKVSPANAQYLQALLEQGRPILVADLIAMQEEARRELQC